MSNTQPENLRRRVTLECAGCGTPLLTQVGAAKSSGGVRWCEDCYPERKRETDRANYQRAMRDPKRRAKKKAQWTKSNAKRRGKAT